MKALPGSPAAAGETPLPRPRGDVHFRRSEPEETLREVHDYWRRQRGSRRYPARADIDPVEIPHLLREVILVDVIGAPPRFRKRLVGSAIVAKEGADSTGDWLHETVNPAIREEVLRQHREAVELPEGNCYTVEFVGDDGKLYSYQRLLLPLSCDGQRVDMLFGAARFRPPQLPRHLFPTPLRLPRRS